MKYLKWCTKKKCEEVHYLAFDRQLFGFSPLGSLLNNNVKIQRKENEIIEQLIEKQEVCSLLPHFNVSLYPIKKLSDIEYTIDLKNIDKHFKDILYLNDKVYKTKYMFVDYGHGAENMDKSLIEKYLNELLQKSKFLESIYIEQE